MIDLVVIEKPIFIIGALSTPPAEFRKQQAKAEAPTSALQYRRSHRRAPSQHRRGPPPLRRYAGDVLAPVSERNAVQQTHSLDMRRHEAIWSYTSGYMVIYIRLYGVI